MSDELIEGHALRGQQSEPEKESPRPSTHVRKGAPPGDEPTGPYIILEPPPEAGNVLIRQSEMSTFHKGLQPIVIEETASDSVQTTDQPESQPESSDSLDLSADLPWSVIESTPPDLFAGKKPESQPGTKEPAAEPPSDFLPHFHTPTGSFPPIKDDLLAAPDVEESTQPADEPEAKPETPSAGPPPDFLPHFHTPTGIFPRIEDDLLPDQEAEEPAPAAAEPEVPPAEPLDSLPHYRTPAGIFPPVRDDRLEPEEPAPETADPETPPAEPPDFLPHYRTPAGIFPPVKDDQLPAQDMEEYAPPPKAKPEMLPVVPVPDLGEPVPVTHFQEGLHPSEEIEDTAPPPVAPVSSEPSEFIPLFHTPTGVLPRVPDEAPVLLSSVGITGEETGDEVVDAEWVVDVDRRLQHARRKLKATAHQATTSDRKMKSRLLTALAVIVITVLAIIIPIAIRFAAGGASMPPNETEAPTQLPGGIVPGEMQTPGVPLLLTPTATTPPLYSQGRLAYSSNRDGDFEVYVLDMRNGQLTRLTDNPAADRSPKWSPDGRQLVFVSDRSGNDDLYLVSTSRSEPVKLTSDDGSDRNPAWSPDGSSIVFSRETVDGSHLMSMPSSCLSDPDTCESQTSALTPGGYDLFPDWSPDGRWVAFAASDFPGLPSVIALISPEGDSYNALPGTGTSDFFPAWSPDGNRIAFVSYAQGDYDLWVMGADGKGLLQLTQSEATDVEPVWSPDGTYIVFASDRSAEGDFELFLIRSDCTSPQAQCEEALIQLTNDSSDDLNPDWIR